MTEDARSYRKSSRLTTPGNLSYVTRVMTAVFLRSLPARPALLLAYRLIACQRCLLNLGNVRGKWYCSGQHTCWCGSTPLELSQWQGRKVPPTLNFKMLWRTRWKKLAWRVVVPLLYTYLAEQFLVSERRVCHARTNRSWSSRRLQTWADCHNHCCACFWCRNGCRSVAHPLLVDKFYVSRVIYSYHDADSQATATIEAVVYTWVCFILKRTRRHCVAGLVLSKTFPVS